MKSAKLIFTAAIFSVFFLTSCNIRFNEYDLNNAFYRLMKVERRATDLKILSDEENIKAIGEDEEYDVLIVTDVHFGNENHGENGPRREADWLESLQKENEDGTRIIDNVRFAISLGDVAEHGSRSECDNFNANITEKLLEIKTTKCPDGIKLYSIVGNHDLYNDGWENWAETMYPNTSFYKFETPSFSWYFLDSASGTLGDYQYEAFKKAMVSDSKQKLIFSHVPVCADNFYYFIMQNTEERNKIISTCGANQTQYFIDGHTHDDRTSDFGTFIERNLPGFLEDYGYGILHVNEKDKTTSVRVEYF